MIKLTKPSSPGRKLPIMQFGVLPGAVRFADSATLYTHPAYAGLLLKKVSCIEELLASCTGIACEFDYNDYGNIRLRHFMVQGEVAQYALDHRFPDGPDDLGFHIAENNTALCNALSTLIAPIPNEAVPFVGKTNTSLGSLPVPADESARVLKTVMGVISGAHAGYGSPSIGHPDGSVNGFWLSTRVDFSSIGRVFTDEREQLFGGAGAAQEYVDQAFEEFMTSDERRHVLIGCHLITTNTPRSASTGDAADIAKAAFYSAGVRFGFPYICPSYPTGRMIYPEKDHPFINRCQPVISPDSTENPNLADIATAHLLAHEAKGSIEETIGRKLITGRKAALALEDIMAPLAALPELVNGSGLAAQAPVYDANQQPISIGSLTNVGHMHPAVVRAIDSYFGLPGYSEMVSAQRWIMDRAEAIARDSI